MKNQKYMKLSEYAKNHNITIRTAWKHFINNKIEGAFKTNTNRIYIPIDNQVINNNNKIIIYTRVSSNENKQNLETQSERLVNYATSKDYQIIDIIKEVGSGVNDNRKKLQSLLNRNDYEIILVEHKDRLTRFGFNYIETLLINQNKKIEVVNLADNKSEDIMQDFISIIYSFSARLYGQRKSKRKTTEIIKILEDNN